MKHHLHIRAASRDDLPTIQRLLKQNNLSYDDAGSFLESFLVAENDGTIIGTIGFEPYGTTGLLRSAAVDPAWQGQGIGSSLTEALAGEAARRGIRELVLLTTSAEQFFSKRGFTRILRESINGKILESSQFRGACPDHAAIMVKSL